MIVAGNIITSIQTIISRNLSYSEKAVISIGKFMVEIDTILLQMRL